MLEIKPIKLWGHVAGPHPWKVIIVFKELAIPFEVEFLNAKQMKQEAYVSICPNGLVPTIEDPNTGITLWESATIVEYLEDMYDTTDKLKYSTFPEIYYQKKWQHFQIAAQDTFFGQKAYYTMVTTCPNDFQHVPWLPILQFHTDQDLSSVYEHYSKQIRHVLGVIETHLKTTRQQYLVNDKCTFADLMFVPFNVVVSPLLMGPEFEQEWKQDMPRSFEWHQRLMNRPHVEEAFEEKYKAMDAAGWPVVGAPTKAFQDAK